MISVGAAIAFAIISGIAGLVVGGLIGEHERRTAPETDVASEWGGINAAATEAYRGAHTEAVARGDLYWQEPGEPLTPAELELYAFAARQTPPGARGPAMFLTCDLVGYMGVPYGLTDEAFEQLAGAPRETILRALIPA